MPDAGRDHMGARPPSAVAKAARMSDDTPYEVSDVFDGLPVALRQKLGVEPDADAEMLPPCSEEAMALGFSARHANDLRYLASTGHWLLWRTTHWRVESTLRVFDFSRMICREHSAEVMAWEKPNLKLAATVASAKTVAAIVSLARADRRHATEADAWNQQHTALATSGGTIELQNSLPRISHRSDLCTKITSVAPKNSETPKWTEFLKKITGNNQELESYLQRVAGYCATGETREQVVFFLWGTGANGKGVFIKTIADVLNDYATVASMDLFLESHNEHHPTDLAHLWGARLVYCQETDRNRRWAEAKLKAMTGGDKLTARFMRQDFFDFVPRFKIVIAGNHKPSLRGVDEAIRRRLQLVPFTVTIPKEERDLKLADSLKAEWPGILQWIVNGAKVWYAQGLQPPRAVTEASETYFAEQDRHAKWLDECCIIEKAKTAYTATLFANWAKWCEDGDEPVGSAKAFSQKLDECGFVRIRGPRGERMFSGLCLTDEAAGFRGP
jgi:putative DNA primase/helicase